jgi:hypothetical protein
MHGICLPRGMPTVRHTPHQYTGSHLIAGKAFQRNLPCVAFCSQRTFSHRSGSQPRNRRGREISRVCIDGNTAKRENIVVGMQFLGLDQLGRSIILNSRKWSRYSSTLKTLSSNTPVTVHAKVDDRDTLSTGGQVSNRATVAAEAIVDDRERRGWSKSEVETRRLSLSEKIHVPKPSLQVKPFEHAQRATELFFGWQHVMSQVNTRARWINGNTLGSPILLIDDNIQPFTVGFGMGRPPWKWCANDKDRWRREVPGSVSMTDDWKERRQPNRQSHSEIYGTRISILPWQTVLQSSGLPLGTMCWWKLSRQARAKPMSLWKCKLGDVDQ